MTPLYDGVGELLNDTFGSPLTHLPAAGGSRELWGVFRAPAIESQAEDGHPMLDVAPVLRLLAADAAGVAIGDTVQPGDGSTYTVQNRQPSGSPASDAFVFFDLERTP